MYIFYLNFAVVAAEAVRRHLQRRLALVLVQLKSVARLRMTRRQRSSGSGGGDGGGGGGSGAGGDGDGGSSSVAGGAASVQCPPCLSYCCSRTTCLPPEQVPKGRRAFTNMAANPIDMYLLLCMYCVLHIYEYIYTVRYCCI
jgi:hypothetical protein